MTLKEAYISVSRVICLICSLSLIIRSLSDTLHSEYQCAP